MKHLYTALLILILITSCGGKTKKESTTKSNYYEYSEPKQTYKIPESKPGSMEGLNNVSTI